MGIAAGDYTIFERFQGQDQATGLLHGRGTSWMKKSLEDFPFRPGCHSWGQLLRSIILTDEVAPNKGIFSKIPKMIVA
jgi:hypothetical protein